MEAAWTGLRVACVALGVLSQVAERGGETACCCRLRPNRPAALSIAFGFGLSTAFDFDSSAAFDFDFIDCV